MDTIDGLDKDFDKSKYSDEEKYERDICN